jgi:hypothetical protein
LCPNSCNDAFVNNQQPCPAYPPCTSFEYRCEVGQWSQCPSGCLQVTQYL